jgi:hypothetical protein
MTGAPVYATGLFFDDIRFEVGNKLSLMGMYQGELQRYSPDMIIDRIGVIVLAKWSYEDPPTHCRIVCEVPRTTIPPLDLPLLDAPNVPPQETRSPFAGIVLTVPFNIRLPNLVGGEAVAVWMEVNDERVPLGRLVVKDVFAAAPTTAD